MPMHYTCINCECKFPSNEFDHVEHICKECRKILKPCPFCGGAAELEQTGKKQLTIKCKHCHVKRQQRVLRHSLEWLEGKMIEAWNERAL